VDLVFKARDPEAEERSKTWAYIGVGAMLVAAWLGMNAVGVAERWPYLLVLALAFAYMLVGSASAIDDNEPGSAERAGADDPAAISPAERVRIVHDDSRGD
jgi:hypothetical protein